MVPSTETTRPVQTRTIDSPIAANLPDMAMELEEAALGFIGHGFDNRGDPGSPNRASSLRTFRPFGRGVPRKRRSSASSRTGDLGADRPAGGSRRPGDDRRYKTNRPRPGISTIFHRLPAADGKHRKLIHGLYPDKRIEEFLIWTDGQGSWRSPETPAGVDGAPLRPRFTRVNFDRLADLASWRRFEPIISTT